MARQSFLDEIIFDLAVFPVTVQIAQIAGRIKGEQAARGIGIPVEDLLIGATALFLDYSLATLNDKHFKSIPGLRLVGFLP